MHFALSLSDEALKAFGLNRDDLEVLDQQEDHFLVVSREYENAGGPPLQGITSAEILDFARREQAELDAAAFPPFHFFQTTGSLCSRQQQLPPPLPMFTPGASPQVLLPLSPRPFRDADWTLIRGIFVNGTNTYHSYSCEPGGGQWTGRPLLDGERVYNECGHWFALVQADHITLGGGANPYLHQMVRDVGGDPDSFETRSAMAHFVLAQERPLGVFRREDAGEVFQGFLPVVDLGHPASGCFWGVGWWEGRVLDIATSTHSELEKVR